MSRFDGTTKPLTYGEALCEIVNAVRWPSEVHGADVLKAVQVEHGLYVVPQEEQRANEIERLRAIVAERDAADKAAAEAAELVALRESLGLDPVTGEKKSPAGDETDALASV